MKTHSLTLLGVLVATCAQAQTSQANDHLLGRCGYGQDAWSAKRIKDLGRARYVDEQLAPRRLADGGLNTILSDPLYDGLRMTVPELRATYGPQRAMTGADVLHLGQVETILRAKNSRRQLEALLTEFWFNHFNVDLGGKDRLYLIPYLRDTIRPNVLGRFEDLLMAVAKSPAMMIYLDNTSSYRNGFTDRNGNERGLNENYARELMELHTFGVDDRSGVYTQKDIVELARALTGWAADKRNSSPTGFAFFGNRHDKDAKQIMGLSLPAGGKIEDGEAAIRYLAAHPQTARNICAKLVQFFVGPGQRALVQQTTQRFMDTGGDLKKVMRYLLLCPEITRTRDAKVKRPLLFVVSAMRSAGITLGGAQARYDRLKALAVDIKVMGQPLFEVPPPTGWDDTNSAFVNEGILLERFNRIEAIVSGSRKLPMSFKPNARGGALIKAVMNQAFGFAGGGDQTRAALAAFESTLPSSMGNDGRKRAVLALAFCSREFNRY